MLELLIGKLVTLLIVMLAGVGLSRTGLIDVSLRKGLNRLLFYFVLPIMVFMSMRGSITAELLRTSYVPVLFGVGLCAFNLLSSQALAALFGIPLDERRLFTFLSMFGNNLYIGLPIALALFGSQGVAIVLLYSLGSDIILWSFGLLLLSPRQKFTLASLKQIFTPTLVGLFLGAAAGAFGVWLPVTLSDAMSQVASVASPLALLLTGAALGEINLKQNLVTRHVPALLLVKLIIAPIFAALIVSILGLSPMLTTIMIIMAGMPTFVRSIVITDQFGWNGQQTAIGVLVTTLGSFITIPLILHFFN